MNDFLQKNGNTFPVADKLIEVAEYYGFDGWFLNQETAGGNAQTALNMRDFMIYFQENSDLEIEWYDAMTENGNVSWQNQLNTLNDWYFQWGDTLVSETMFLNFWWNAAFLNNSRTYAQSLNRSEYDLFSGIDVEANGYNTGINWSAPFPNGSLMLHRLAFTDLTGVTIHQRVLQIIIIVQAYSGLAGITIRATQQPQTAGKEWQTKFLLSHP